MESYNFYISDGENRYKIRRPIGTWGPNFSLIVYEVLVIDSDNKTSLAAFKMIKDTIAFQDHHEMVVDDVNRSIGSARGCRYILPITKAFYSQIHSVMTLCIVLPYDSHVVSLRSLISNNPSFTHGIHDKFIAIVLVRVLKALRKIHKKGIFHMQITAGNIYYNAETDNIQLAYAASAYERHTTPGYSTPFSVNKMLSWALAPEVMDEAAVQFVDTYMIDKSDIWLVGITALELAYGKIQVQGRKELLDIASYISERKNLPNTWEELRHKSAEWIADRALPIKKRRFESASHASSTDLSTEESRLSASFCDFVATCLAVDLYERPSVKKLKKHVFLKKNVGSVQNFREVIVKGKNPHVARLLSEKPKRKPSDMRRERSLPPSRLSSS